MQNTSPNMIHMNAYVCLQYPNFRHRGIEKMDLDASVVLMRKARMQKVASAASHNSALFCGLHLKHTRPRVSRWSVHFQ